MKRSILLLCVLGFCAALTGCDAAVRAEGDGEVVDDAIVFHPDGNAYCPFCGESIDLTDEDNRAALCTNCKEEVRVVGRRVICSDCGGSGVCHLCLGSGVGEHISTCRCAVAEERGNCPICEGEGFLLMGDVKPKQDQ